VVDLDDREIGSEATDPARSSATSAAQELWHVPKTHQLELFKERLLRRTAVQPATLTALLSRSSVDAAIVPRPELPWQAEPEVQPVVTVPANEVRIRKMRRMSEPQHEIAGAEL
jgi:hypothetical protein